MNRNKKIGTLLVGNGRTSFEWNESVVLTGVDNFRAQSGIKQLAQPPADFQHQIFFFQAIRPDSSRIVAAMPGIDHNPADLQSQSADQRAVPTGGRLRLPSIKI